MSTSREPGPQDPPARLQVGWQSRFSRPVGFVASSSDAASDASSDASDRSAVDLGQASSASANRTPVRVGDDGHLFTVAPTGKGKGRSCIIPTLLRYPGSALVVDPKGEAAATTAAHRASFGEVVLLDPFHLVTDTPDRFNPMDIAQASSGSTVDTALMLTELLHPGFKGSLQDPFWDNWADIILSGAIAFVLEHRAQADQTLLRVRRILTNDDVTYTLAVMLDTMSSMNPYAKSCFEQFLQLPSERTRPSALATAQQHLRLIGDPVVEAAIDSTTFDLQAFIDGDPMTIYLILPPSKLRSHAALLRCWIASLLTLTVERTRRPPLSTLFMIDEAAQLGTLESLRTATSLLRGYGVRVWSFWQDLSQLKRLYPTDWETMINNADALQTFGATTWKMASDITEIIGGVSPHQFLGLDRTEQIVAKPGGEVIICEKLDYLRDKQFQGLYEPNPMFEVPHQGIYPSSPER